MNGGKRRMTVVNLVHNVQQPLEPQYLSETPLYLVEIVNWVDAFTFPEEDLKWEITGRLTITFLSM